MPATEASEVLERFAGGSAIDVCSADGRARLRGAVRAYGAELNANGVAWPAVPGAVGSEGALNGTDASVVIAFAAGFVEVSDFHGPARRLVSQISFAQWPQIRDLRAAADVACQDVVALQRAAAHMLMESERYDEMLGRDRSGAADQERLRRQAQRVERARFQMDDAAAVVAARMEARGA